VGVTYLNFFSDQAGVFPALVLRILGGKKKFSPKFLLSGSKETPKAPSFFPFSEEVARCGEESSDGGNKTQGEWRGVVYLG